MAKRDTAVGEAIGAASMNKIIVFLISCFFINFSYANTMYPFETAKQEVQFEHLLKNLRCLVCQNQDLADSNADLAKDLRMQVYNLVKEGRTDTEINDYLSSRYGDFVLFKPPVKELTLLLWFGPLLFLLCGVVIFWRTCFKRANDE